MKILIFRTCSTPISLNTYNLQEVGLAKALIKKGHQCDIIYYTKDNRESEQYIDVDGNNKIKIYWLPAINLLHVGIFDKNKILEICSNYDLVQTSDYDQYMSYYLTNILDKPTVIYHGPYKNDFIKYKAGLVNKVFDFIFLKKMLNKQPTIISKSRLTEDTLREKGFNNIVNLGVGFDKSRFSDRTSNNLDLNIIDAMKGKNIMLYVGNTCPRRSTDFLIKTFYKVSQRVEDPLLVIVGTGKEKYVRKYKKLINDLNLNEKVLWIDKLEQTKLPKIYENAKVFVLPTKYEIFGMVLLESIYFKLPIVTTYNGGSITLLENNKEHRILNLYNQDEWVDTISEILMRPKQDINSSIIYNFTWDSLVDKFIEVYENIYNSY